MGVNQAQVELLLSDPSIQPLVSRLMTCVADHQDVFQLQLDEQTATRLVAYLALLNKWNAAYNLTAVRNVNDMFSKHLLDSLVVIQYVNEQRVIDVGTGAGLPGVPLAILRPEKEVTLLDSNGKKTRFLDHVKMTLGLDNVTVVHARIESQTERRFDAVISRAFTALDNMLALCSNACTDSGVFYAMKGMFPQEELDAVSEEYQLVSSVKLAVPELDSERHLLTLRKRAFS